MNIALIMQSYLRAHRSSSALSWGDTMKQEVTNRFPCSGWMSRTCPGACFGGGCTLAFQGGVCCCGPFLPWQEELELLISSWDIFQAGRKASGCREESEQPPPEKETSRTPPEEMSSQGWTWYKGWWYLGIHPTRFASPKWGSKCIHPQMLCSW